jgi:hypothetical protein
MKHEVINISTSTERYIANGVLTHNKDDGFGNEVGGCPNGSTYTGGQTQRFNNRINITYQASYVPRLPITITLSSDSDINYNYAEISTGPCYIPASLPYTRTSFRSGSTSISTWTTSTTGKMTYIPNSYGWRANFPVTFSVEYLSGIQEDTIFHWSAKVSAKDSTNVFGTNPMNPRATGYFTIQGGVGACLTPDTLIELYDGKTVFLNSIKVGDRLLSINPDTGQNEESIVESKSYYKVDYLYIINYGLLRCSESHKHIVKRNGDWIVITTNELALGDELLTKDLDYVVITNIDKIN